MSKKLRRKVKKIRPAEKPAVQNIAEEISTGSQQKKDQKKKHYVFRNVMFMISALICTLGVFFCSDKSLGI
jgi:hypothetical protein